MTKKPCRITRIGSGGDSPELPTKWFGFRRAILFVLSQQFCVGFPGSMKGSSIFLLRQPVQHVLVRSQPLSATIIRGWFCSSAHFIERPGHTQERRKWTEKRVRDVEKTTRSVPSRRSKLASVSRKPCCLYRPAPKFNGSPGESRPVARGLVVPNAVRFAELGCA